MFLVVGWLLVVGCEQSRVGAKCKPTLLLRGNDKDGALWWLPRRFGNDKDGAL